MAKIGQYPALARMIDAPLRGFLGSVLADHYVKALTLRNSNFGIGAVAYLRRVVEDRVHELVDLVVEAAAQDGSTDAADRARSIRSSRNFTEKIDAAADILPESLRFGGHNPIKLLHELTSAGLHGQTEEECVDIFDCCQAAFEYVVERLATDKAKDEGYAAAIRKLTEAKDSVTGKR